MVKTSLKASGAGFGGEQAREDGIQPKSAFSRRGDASGCGIQKTARGQFPQAARLDQIIK